MLHIPEIKIKVTIIGLEHLTNETAFFRPPKGFLTLNSNKKGPYSRRGFRNELNLLEQIFCEYLQSGAYQSVFFDSEPTMNYSPYW